MRVLAVVLGSTGDVAPFVALGRRMARDAHELAIACFPDLEQMVDDAGLEYLKVPGDADAWMKRLLGDARSPSDAIRGVREVIGDPAIFRALEAEVPGRDLVLYTQFGVAARHLAEAHGLPCVRVLVYPTDPNRSYALVDPRRNDGTWRAVMSHRISNFMMNWALRPAIKQWRSGLGLGGWGLFSDDTRMAGHPLPTLYQFSPTLVPPDPAWGSHIHVTGEWLDDSRDDQVLPPAVADFLDRGPAPVLVGFGSVRSSVDTRVHEVVRISLRARGERVLVVRPDVPETIADDVATVSRVPFGPLLPRCRAVICHGSLGTTGAALRAGLPCLALAFGGDQQFHGQSLARAGAGPAYIDVIRDGLEPQLYDERIKELLSGRYDRPVARLAARLRAENGIEHALEVLTNLVTDDGQVRHEDHDHSAGAVRQEWP